MHGAAIPMAYVYPDPATQQTVSTHVRRVGVRTAARDLTIAPNTIARVCAGLPVSTGTIAVVIQRLESLDAEGTR